MIARRLALLFFTLLSTLLPVCLTHAQSSPSSFFPSLNSFDNSNENTTEKPKKGPSKTEVTAEDEATFNNNTNIGEFFGHVTVKNDQFNLFCNHLIITLRKDRRGLQHGEAIGDVVITQENVDTDGNVTRSIGRAGRANYDPVTGDVLLTEWPQLQQGINNHIAIDKHTRMTLNKDGQSTTIGHSKTVIVDTQKNISPAE